MKIIDPSNGESQWRMTCGQKSPSKHIQIRNGGTRKVTNACSTAVNIQSTRSQRVRSIERYMLSLPEATGARLFLSQPITTLENISYISLAQPELKKLWMRKLKSHR